MLLNSGSQHQFLMYASLLRHASSPKLGHGDCGVVLQLAAQQGCRLDDTYSLAVLAAALHEVPRAWAAQASRAPRAMPLQVCGQRQQQAWQQQAHCCRSGGRWPAAAATRGAAQLMRAAACRCNATDSAPPNHRPFWTSSVLAQPPSRSATRQCLTQLAARAYQ